MAFPFYSVGFCELIPGQLLRPFDERELELVIGGISSIDVNDWRVNTRLKHCTPETQQVIWFWQVIVNDFLHNLLFAICLSIFFYL